MIFNPLLQANNIAVHDVINEDVCPSVPLVTGDSFNFRDADIKIRVNGNRCGVPTEALTFKIIVKGNGFRAILRAIWGRDQRDHRPSDDCPGGRSNRFQLLASTYRSGDWVRAGCGSF